MYDHLNEKLLSSTSCDTVNCAVQVVLTFKSVDETLVCDHLHESY